MARGDFSRIIVGPVLEAGSEPRAACFAASSLGVILQGRRSQVGVVDVALRSVGEELALRPRGAGCRLEERGSVQRPIRQAGQDELGNKETEKKTDDLP